MNTKENVAQLLSTLRNQCPLIHHITNYVTVNDVANATLAIGASPVMADDIMEVTDITAIASALVINIGTLNQRTVVSMIAAGKKANELGIPVVFDPVGAGASTMRNDVTRAIMREVKIDILRGNLSEISLIAGLEASTKGVDSSIADEKNDSVTVALTVAKTLKTIVAITGAVDVISDGTQTVQISNGHPLLSKVTGTGCMSTALVGSFAAAGQKTDYFYAAVAGIASMGIAGEIAFDKASSLGTGSFHIAIIDALSQLEPKQLQERIKLNEHR